MLVPIIVVLGPLVGRGVVMVLRLGLLDASDVGFLDDLLVLFSVILLVLVSCLSMALLG